MGVWRGYAPPNTHLSPNFRIDSYSLSRDQCASNHLVDMNQLPDSRLPIPASSTGLKFLRSKYFRFSLSLLIGVLSLYLALRNVSLEDLGMSIRGADWGWVGLALLSVVINNLAKAARWQVLTGKGTGKIGFGRLFLALLAGQALNSLYPARVGDLGRAYVAGGKSTSRAFLLGTIALEKIVELLSYGVLLLLVILWMPLPVWLNRSVYVLIGVALVLVVVALVMSRNQVWSSRFLEWFREWRPNWIPQRAEGILHAAVDSLGVLRSSWELVKLAFWSVMVWGVAISTNYLVLRALDIQLAGVIGETAGIPVSFLAACLVLVGLTVGISVPIPGRIGIFEGICVYVLGVFGVLQADAFVYGVLLHMIVFLPTTLAGLISLVVLGLPGKREKLLEIVEEPGR